jgi:hypothetical protein
MTTTANRWMAPATESGRANTHSIVPGNRLLGLPLSVPSLRHQRPELALEFCKRSDERYENIRQRHYVKNRGAQGQQVHFLILYREQIIGIISGGSAVWASAPRDSFFRINGANRKRVLNGIVNNTIFRLETREPNLATRCLSLWRKVVVQIWLDIYQVPVFGFETFVVETDYRKGTLYRADNWSFLGETLATTNPPKLIYGKWCDDVSNPIETEYTSSWRAATNVEKRRAKELGTQRKSYEGRIFYTFGKGIATMSTGRWRHDRYEKTTK